MKPPAGAGGFRRLKVPVSKSADGDHRVRLFDLPDELVVVDVDGTRKNRDHLTRWAMARTNRRE
ncbi:hypothetical protein GCM10022252_69180 [Streptosporangium oxazolinicum]|uniref:Uncharacterized protein n=1 Tax=Streptosporangium oxazolinicum TaxID=909287 RepID=A0ABP8BH10_9ACTN